MTALLAFALGFVLAWLLARRRVAVLRAALVEAAASLERIEPDGQVLRLVRLCLRGLP